MPQESAANGTGRLRSGQHDLGLAHYQIHVVNPNRPGTVVELESPPRAQDGEVLDLTVEDGRVLQIQVRGVSPYCRVIGERPAHERRHPSWDPALSADGEGNRRRTDARGSVTIAHPCPRCLAPEVVVTHRGLTVTTLFCPRCRHGWGEPPAVVAAAARTERRIAVRPESSDRRSTERLAAPICEYCETNAHVQPARRTPQEVFFVCTICDAMWALPRSTGPAPPAPSLSR